MDIHGLPYTLPAVALRSGLGGILSTKLGIWVEVMYVEVLPRAEGVELIPDCWNWKEIWRGGLLW